MQFLFQGCLINICFLSKHTFFSPTFWISCHLYVFSTQDRDLGDEYGWKQVHGDVFRPSSHPLIFSSLIGSGCQIFSVSFIVIVLAMIEDLYTEWVLPLRTMQNYLHYLYSIYLFGTGLEWELVVEIHLHLDILIQTYLHALHSYILLSHALPAV